VRSVEASTFIDATPERVWALYADIARTPEWVPFVEEVVSVSGPLAVGMTYRERTRIGRIRGVQEWRIDELEPPRRRVETSESLRMHSRLTITMEREGSGTQLRQVSEVRSTLPRPLGWLQESFVGLVARRAMRAAVLGAKRTLENVRSP
jgi:uncharacterized protein YndB with AHSA1/START domain